jgi:4'-phosphopantetheinyl transferase
MASMTALDDGSGLALWLCALHEMPEPRQQAWLDADEVERAERFVHDVHRRRHVASHVALRDRLASAVGASAEALRFRADAHGKPQLEGQGRVQFNLSHSEDWALVAVGVDAPIGVDLEMLRPVEEALALARKHYTPAEAAAVQDAVGARARDEAFLRVWTRKEACLKAVGLGLRLAP